MKVDIKFLNREEVENLPRTFINNGHLIFTMPEITEPVIETILNKQLKYDYDGFSESVYIKLTVNNSIFSIYLYLYFKRNIARIGGIYNVDYILNYRSEIIDKIKIIYINSLFT